MREGLQSDAAATPAGPATSERERLDEEMREAGITAGDIVETIRDPLVVLTPDFRVQVVNPAFYEHFRVSPEETTGRLIYELGNGQWDIPDLHTLLEEILPENDSFNGYEVVHEFEDLGWRAMLLNARRLDHLELIPSREGGTTFSIRLPRDPPKEPVTEITTSRIPRCANPGW